MAMRSGIFSFSKRQCRHRYFSSDFLCLSETHVIQTFRIPTNLVEPITVPMTLIDVHLRDEQLPFCYFFHDTLDADLLQASLAKLLNQYPILGGTLNIGRGTIDLTPGDSVSLSFSKSDTSMQEMLRTEPQHFHRGGQHPQLLPLFDSLRKDNSPLATVRVTYFKGGGTALGVNLSHALADAASCVRFVQCWGRAMQNLQYPQSASNERSTATCSGMISPELLDVMNLGNETPHWLESYFFSKKDVAETAVSILEEVPDEMTVDTHEYVNLTFSPQVLKAMKAYGMAQCHGTDFVSTNDMVTAFGWLMKRQLSGRADWDMSMVVNLRGRSGVDEFSDINDGDGFKGVFGNGITNVIASLPGTIPGSVGLEHIGIAAVAIRAALTAGLLEVPNRLALSKMGKQQATASSGGSFAFASWQHFPVWDISFSSSLNGLAGFHGHPSHPLPTGDTYISIIVPRKCGGHTYQLLAPVAKSKEAKTFHNEICLLFLQWYDEHTKTQADQR